MTKTYFVTRRERKIANARGLKIVREVQKKLRPKYKMNPLLVGSARYNAVVKDKNGVYDMDYQLLLTHNCKEFDANQIRKDFLQAFNDVKNNNEKVENSTSVITVRVSNSTDEFETEQETFSFDFAIIVECNDGSYITRRDGVNHYTWNKLPSKNSYIYDRFYSFNNDAQNKIIDKVITRKIKEKKKPKDNQVASYVIFMEEVNNYRG